MGQELVLKTFFNRHEVSSDVLNPRNTQIGIISGEILNLIDQKKIPVNITEIMSHFDDMGDLIHTSIDWLIREGHVHLIKNGEDKYLCNC